MNGRVPACGGCTGVAALFPFTMAFQPVVDVVEREIVAHEALVRGPGGESAGSVLAQVDANNLYAFDQACRVKAIELAASLGMPGRLNINFLPNAVYNPRACIQATLQAAARARFDTARLTFEIVETAANTEDGHLSGIVTEYRRQGFKVALDDFGTGFSGLSRLADLAPDVIKLDRRLIANCQADRVRLAIVSSLISLGAAVGAMIVVEGVETPAEYDALRTVGARYMQGFLFSRPVLEGFADRLDVFRSVSAG